jgi:broad specificity phosphatase PhoE
VRCVILLVRHALTDAVGVRLTSRQPGVPLNARGFEQVSDIAACLREVPLAAVYSSPLERTIATASPIASTHALEPRTLDALNEVDFGEWTGLTLAELSGLPDWRRFNEHRASADVPGGERAADVQRRIVAALETLQRRHAGEVIAAVSHGDVIRAAVLHIASTPLDLWYRFEISPASVTTIIYEEGSPRLLAVNATPGRLAYETQAR